MLFRCIHSTALYTVLWVHAMTTITTSSVQVQAFITSTDLRKALKFPAETASSRLDHFDSTVPASTENSQLSPTEDLGAEQCTPLTSNDGSKSSPSSERDRIIKKYAQLDKENEKKKEKASVKKERMVAFFKELQEANKRASKVDRPMSIYAKERIPLTSFNPGDGPIEGTVISLTNYGAYVDVGTECDGLLHISQITRDMFLEHPRQVLRAGEHVNVWIVNRSPDLKKLQVTMLDPTSQKQSRFSVDEDDDDDDERIPLSELEADDELWGVIQRVTSYGAYVELGTEVEGWLHFMDHPEFEFGKVPNEFMRMGDRIRCWVVNVDLDRDRLKLTANRPANLPGPRRELKP